MSLSAQFSPGIALTSALWTRWECETDLWWLNWQQQNLRFLPCEKHLYTAPPARVCNQESRIHGQPPPCSLPATHPPKCSQRLIKWAEVERFLKKKSALMLISKAEEWSDKRTMDRAGSHTRKGNDCVFFCTCSWVFEKSTLCRHVGLWPSFTISTPLDSVSTGEIAFLSANSLLCLPAHHVAWISGSMHAAKHNPQPYETLCWGSAEGLLYMHSIEV